MAVTGEVGHRRRPAPFPFVTVPPGPAAAIRDVAALVTYGWGVIPVGVRLGATRFTTWLCPKGGGYLVPRKGAVRAAEGVALGDVVTLRLHLAL